MSSRLTLIDRRIVGLGVELGVCTLHIVLQRRANCGKAIWRTRRIDVNIRPTVRRSAWQGPTGTRQRRGPAGSRVRRGSAGACLAWVVLAGIPTMSVESQAGWKVDLKETLGMIPAYGVAQPGDSLRGAVTRHRRLKIRVGRGRTCGDEAGPATRACDFHVVLCIRRRSAGQGHAITPGTRRRTSTSARCATSRTYCATSGCGSRAASRSTSATSPPPARPPAGSRTCSRRARSTCSSGGEAPPRPALPGGRGAPLAARIPRGTRSGTPCYPARPETPSPGGGGSGGARPGGGGSGGERAAGAQPSPASHARTSAPCSSSRGGGRRAPTPPPESSIGTRGNSTSGPEPPSMRSVSVTSIPSEAA